MRKADEAKEVSKDDAIAGSRAEKNADKIGKDIDQDFNRR